MQAMENRPKGDLMSGIVRVENLVKRYGDLLALDHFNLRIAKGEIFGLLGPNGSGKTTSINCILQLLTYDKGHIELFGEPTVAVDPQSRNSILDGICRLRDEGATVVYTSHYMEEVEQICSRIMIMDGDRTLAEGTNDELKRMISMGEKVVIEAAELADDVLASVRGLPHVLSASYAAGALTCS